MNTREYYELFRYLMEQYCLFPEDIVFVDNIADWCKEKGIPEPDQEQPLKLGGKSPLDKNGKLAKKLSEHFGSYEAWEKDFKATGTMRGIGCSSW